MRITHLKRRAFPSRYGPGGNGGAAYGLSGPISVTELRRLVAIERDYRLPCGCEPSTHCPGRHP